MSSVRFLAAFSLVAAALGAAADEPRSLTVPARLDGVVVALGTEAADEKADTARVVEWPTLMVALTDAEVKDGKATGAVEVEGRKYRSARADDALEPGAVRVVPVKRRIVPLAAAAAVKEGQLLALLDPTLAGTDLALAAIRLDTTGAKVRAAEKVRDAARGRLESLQDAQRRVRGSVTPDAIRSAELDALVLIEEVFSQQQEVRQARLLLRRAQAVVDQHEVRSPTAGTVAQLLRQRGEGVRALDGVVQLRPAP